MKKLLLFIAVLFAITTKVCNAQVILYGTTSAGGTNDSGTLFKMTNGAITTLYSFEASTGADPRAGLCLSNGVLYGTTRGGGPLDEIFPTGEIFSYNISSSTENNAYSFNGYDTDGIQPTGDLIQDSDLLYGLTPYGGNGGGDLNWQFGTLFSYSPGTGAETRLYNFFGNLYNTSHAGVPFGTLMKASDGLLYGLSSEGGGNNAGTIFSYNVRTNNLQVEYSFGYPSSDGAYPVGGHLVQVGDSLLYGMTALGGNDGINGTIFTYNIYTHVEKVVHDFSEYVDGYQPQSATLLLANDGLLYGLTEASFQFYGALFSYDIATGKDSVLYTFGAGSNTDPRLPHGALIQASDGLLYGTSAYGGANNDGEIFSYNITTNKLTDVVDFNGSNGAAPFGDLIEVDKATGINQLSVNSDQLSVYPNPTSGEVTITSTKTIDELKVTNLLGQLVYESQPKQTQFMFELKDEGMYFVTVTSNGETSTSKIIVSK